MFGYRVPAPDQAMLISGGKQKTAGASFQVVIGHGKWIVPGFRKVRFLGLDQHKVIIEESCRSNEGILLHLKAVAAFKVQSDVNSVNAAAQRFLGEQRKGDMEEMTRDIFAGHLRSIVGSMSIDDIHKNRDALAVAIMEHSQTEMSRLGLTVDALQIEHFDDGDSGYLDNRAAPHLARAARDAAMARAAALQETAQAEQEAERKKNDQIRDTQMKQAAIKAQVDKANAEAEAAGQLARADVERQVLEQQQKVADTNAALVERKLIAEQIRPAEAAAKALRINADAQTGASEAAAQRAEWEATANKTRQVRQAEAAAEQVRLEAEAQRDAAAFNAEAVEKKGRADAGATRAKGLAEAEVVEKTGLAEAAGLLKKAEAAAAEGGAQIELAKVNIQPEIARAIASSLGLNGANLTILDGAEGLAKFVGTVATLMPQIGGLGGLFGKQETNGHDRPNGEQQPLTTGQAERALAEARQNR